MVRALVMPPHSTRLILVIIVFWSFPGGTTGKESPYRCIRCGFNIWVGKIPWRRAWQLASVFLPGKFYGQRSLLGYSLWGHKEVDTTEHTQW